MPAFRGAGYDGERVSSPVAARRLEIHAAARGSPAEFVRFAPDRLRFSLGTSLADLAIPVGVAPDARAIVRGAAAEVALLLSTHHGFVPSDDVDRLILREDYAALPRVAPVLGPAGGGPDVRGAAQLGAAIHPALTGGIVCAWLGRGGRGHSLVALWIELLGRAFAEMGAARGREETPLVVALALAAETHAAAERDLRQALPAPPLDRYLGAAAASALWVAARTGLARAWRDTGRAGDDPLLARLEAAISPAPLLGGRAGVLGGGSTLYGCELSAGVPRADEVGARLAAGGDPAAAVADVARALGAEEEHGRRAEHAIAVARAREALAAAIATAEASGQEDAVAPLRALLAAPGALAAAAVDDAARRELAGRLLAGGPAGEPAAALERLARALRAWRAREPAAPFGLGRAAAREAYATACAALLADAAVERWIAGARRALSFRTGREAEGGADAEWEAGRLYRLSAAPGPILRQGGAAPVAHLFADVKDFTRRTALLGQAAMAELLRSEFYVPILVAAKEHFGGMPHLSDRGGVSLNNLLGDAISFSGDIGAMVQLARAIRRRVAEYGARLAREVSRDAVARGLADIEAAHARALADAARARAEADGAASREPPGTPRHAALAALAARRAADEARLVAERDRALARARGEGLEAGVFVSHGPAPLVVTIEDEVFGRNRVAIADRINESARGTARAAPARARADAGLAAERAARRRPALAHAWSVFVGQPLAVAAPPEAEDAALALARAGDLAGGVRALAPAVRDALDAAARARGERAGDVYNCGVALSEDAVSAFLAEVDGRRTVRRVEVELAAIPEALRDRWFFGAEPLSLVACLHPDGTGRVAELFRRVGVAAFKGVGEVAVWELCDEGGAPGALAGALGASWLRGG